MEYQILRLIIIGFLIVLVSVSVGAILATLGAAHLRSRAEQAREDADQWRTVQGGR